MHLFFFNKKYSLLKIYSFIFLLLILSAGNGFVQSVEPLPDSVKAEDDVVEQTVDTVQADYPKKDTVIAVDSVFIRTVPDSAVNQMKNSKDFAYANDPSYWKKETVKYEKGFWDYIFEFGGSVLGKIIFYSLIIGVLVFALYKIIVDNKLYMFYSKPKRLTANGTDEDDSDAEDIDEKIKESLRLNDYRLAIRYMYLKALRVLNDHELIRFNTQATNYEYASQLAGTAFKKEFQYLTNVYEYVWYGGFEINAQQTEMIHQSFNQFYSSVNQ